VEGFYVMEIAVLVLHLGQRSVKDFHGIGTHGLRGSEYVTSDLGGVIPEPTQRAVEFVTSAYRSGDGVVRVGRGDSTYPSGYGLGTSDRIATGSRQTYD
jgi:hypothetical protein